MFVLKIVVNGCRYIYSCVKLAETKIEIKNEKISKMVIWNTD